MTLVLILAVYLLLTVRLPDVARHAIYSEFDTASPRFRCVCVCACVCARARVCVVGGLYIDHKHGAVAVPHVRARALHARRPHCPPVLGGHVLVGAGSGGALNASTRA